ncbi:MAG: hypothetical protein F6J95_023260 [Leptolyngbya sp. SIO1E4]|nr:hypothetical protein [Leptolyngbya sp. SIO1E4]
MALLNRFLRLLELLEQATDVVEFLTTPAGIAIATCLLSYQALLVIGCDGPSAAILASATALTLHCGLNRPKF